MPEETTPKTRFNILPLGFATLALVLCTVAVCLIFWQADGSVVGSWKIGPTVLFQVFSNIISTLLAGIVSILVTIVWWRECRKGTTVKELHTIWTVDKALLIKPQKWRQTVQSSWAVRRLSLGTALITIFSFAIGPLLQQSVHPLGSSSTTETMNVTINMLKDIPSGLSGLVDLKIYTVSFDMTAAAAQWWNHVPINTPKDVKSQCPEDSTCSGIVDGVGISAKSVSVVRQEADLSILPQSDTILFKVFSSDILEEEDGRPYLDIQFIYLESIVAPCTATLVTEHWNLYAARTNSSIEIANKQIIVKPRNSSEWISPRLIFYAGDRLSAKDGDPCGPLRGLLYVFGTYFQSRVFVSATTGKMASLGILSEAYAEYSPKNVYSAWCSTTWKRPTDYVLNGLGETLFRLSTHGKKYLNLNTNPSSIPGPMDIPVSVRSTFIVIQPHYAVFAVAVALIVFAMFTGASLSWGWWDIPRNVSMSPLETAVMVPQSISTSGMEADDIVKTNGNVKVRYAEMEPGACLVVT